MKRAAGRIALVLGSLLVGVAFAEIVTRMTWPEPPSRKVPEGVNPAKLPHLDDFWDLIRHNTQGINRGVYYRSNRWGLRGPNWSQEPAEGVFRIVVAGDSTAMGSGVLEEQRYSDQLQDLFNADGSGRYEVMNTALNGLNIHRGVQRLGLMLPRYRADLFVFGFSPNDIEGENYEKRVENLEESGRIWAWALRNYGSPFYLWRLFTLRAAMMLTESALHSKSDELRYNYLENEAAWADFVRGLEDFAELTRKHGVCGHVLIHTYLDRLGDDHPYLEVYDLVERTARAKGLTVTQTFPIFEGLRADRLWVTQFDRHPSPEGHAMLAEVLYEDLKQLPPRCWQRR